MFIFYRSSASDGFVMREVPSLRKSTLFYAFSTQYNFPPQVLNVDLETQCLYVYSETKYNTRNSVYVYNFMTHYILKYPSVVFNLSAICSYGTESTNSIIMPISVHKHQNLFLTAFHCHLQI